MQKVKVISKQGEAALIEWFDDESLIHRSVVPVRFILEDNYCRHPERGIQYGEDFTALLTLTTTLRELDQALKNSGIWTLDDLFTKHSAAQGAFNLTLSKDFANLVRNARRVHQERQQTHNS